MSQNYSYPSSSQVTISGIGDPVNLPTPSNAVFIAGEDPSGDLKGIQVDSTGKLNVNVGSIPLPTGAATEAKQDSQITLATAQANTISARLSGSLVPAAFNEVDLTYVTVGNGIGQVQTAIYKLSGSTVATLTFTYDSSDRLSSVVKS